VEDDPVKKALLLVLALIVAGCAEPIPRNLDDLSRQGLQYVDPGTLEPYSGPAYRTSEDDPTEIVLRVNLRDGRFHGDFEDFELEGDSLGLYQTGTYRDGQLEGPYGVFYPSGVLRGRGAHENGLREGSYEFYYENGQLQQSGTFVAGERDGPIGFYHENGRLDQRSTYVADERDGPFDSYYENGQLGEKSNYKAGKLDGPIEVYHDNGQLGEKGTYNMGRPCGEWLEDGETVTYRPC
jgi:antitoxin component YwqK of YwqJK toxin-antitoxin module